MDIKEMKFSVLTEKGHAEVRTRPLPELGDRQVLIKQEACNICTTDYGQWLGLREHQGYPMAGGHEGSGTIVAKGKKVMDFEIGDRVAMAYDGCGECESCRKGDVLHCTDTSITGRTEDGYLGAFGFANYAVRNARSVIKVSKDLSPSEAAFLEPLATVVKGLKKLRVKPMENVVIIGAGTMGLVNAQAAKANGCRVIVSEVMEKKLETAKAMGFEVIDAGNCDPVEEVKKLTGGVGADVVIVAVGLTLANNQAIEMLKPTDGRVLFFAAGYPAPQLEFDSNLVHYKRLELIGTFAADSIDFFTAGRMLSDRSVDVSKIIEPTKFKLDDVQKAFEMASKPGMYRVSVLLQD